MAKCFLRIIRAVIKERRVIFENFDLFSLTKHWNRLPDTELIKHTHGSIFPLVKLHSWMFRALKLRVSIKEPCDYSLLQGLN